MRIVERLLQRILRWMDILPPPSPFTDGVRDFGTILRNIEALDAEAEEAAPEPVPLTPEQEAEEYAIAWERMWRRYMRILRQHKADGYVSHPGDLEDAWRDLRLDGDEGGFLYDPRAWKYRELARGPLSESDPVLGPMMKASNARRALILADIDFLIADTTEAPKPDDDPDVYEHRGRSRVDATFGNYLDRW